MELWNSITGYNNVIVTIIITLDDIDSNRYLHREIVVVNFSILQIIFDHDPDSCLVEGREFN